MPNFFESDCHNVKDHGAIGDGKTDDTKSINAAIAASKSDGTCIVFFPKGIYKISSSIVPGYVSLIGPGTQQSPDSRYGFIGSTIEAAPEMKNSVVVYAPYSTSFLDGLSIDGGDESQSNTGILAQSSDDGSPYRARWGNIDILNCAIGFHILEGGGKYHVYYNDFGKLEIRHVGVGLLLEDGVNANHFPHLSVTVYRNAALQTIGTPHGIGIDYFHAETNINGAVGFMIDSCIKIQVAAGYMEMAQPTDFLFKATGLPKGFEYHGYWTYGQIDKLDVQFCKRGNVLSGIVDAKTGALGPPYCP
jgi:Pectate lyase superfamily protein